MIIENEWLPTGKAALALGRSADTLKRKRDSQGGFLEQGYHYCFGDAPNSPITWHVERCLKAFSKRGIAVRKELEKNKEDNSSKSIPREFWLKENGEFHMYLTLTICSYFWSILDKDFGEKVDKESIHEILDLVIPELKLEQCINILNNIDPKKLPKLKKQIEQLLTKNRL